MNNDATNDPHSPETSLSSIRYTFIKSPFFRTIFMNGAWGGVTPRGQLQMSIYTEHHPFPEFTINEVSPEGILGAETDRSQIEGYTREIEVNVIMNLREAVSLRNWLNTRIEQMEQIEQSAPSREADGDTQENPL